MADGETAAGRRSKRDSGLDGLLLVDKEPDWTSHDVVAKVRGLTGQRKIGHTGTLDPAATGLLVLCLGQATRLVRYMSAASKTYLGLIQLGIETETDDAEGKETAQSTVPRLTQAGLDEVASRFTGSIQQAPPAFSAVKVGGERAYALARKGKPQKLAAREVEVHRLELRPSDWPDRLRIEVDCGAGTYIRSLARDIGRELGCGAHLARLRRTTVGGFPVEAALPIGALEALCGAGRLGEALLPFDEGVVKMKAAIVTEAHATELADGRVVVLDEPSNATGTARIFLTDGSLVGLGRVDEAGRLVPERMFRGR
jgi:tRNA pseudouridine55 synthase